MSWETNKLLTSLKPVLLGEVKSTAIKNLLSHAVLIEITSLKRKGKSREREETNGGEESGDLRALRLRFLGNAVQQVVVTNLSLHFIQSQTIAPANR